MDFMEQVNRISGETIQLCYHCHKCTSGCPAALDMAYGPDQVLRMVQLGEKERLLASRDIWLCASCETCGTRCPNEINIARVMDALRQIALSSGAVVAEPQAVKFHRLFLAVVKNLGRSHEASLLALYKIWTGDLLSDMDSGAKLFLKGKIPLLPHPIKARQEVKCLYTAAEEKEGREN